MFYELIHTRCKQGMDIKQGKVLMNEGFKEYACTPALMDNGVVDMPFFADAVKVTASYTDKNDATKLMEDAYFYYTPDAGVNFMVNFHPIPWDKDYPVQGRFSNRSGNFVNHVYAGDFAQAEFYPFELFGDAAWDAKGKEYAYYYDNPPVEMGKRNLRPIGAYNRADLARFIADGREELLAKAVAFVSEQFGKDSRSRKFLVIKDESTANIEMWIAAIQSAFSPRMAAGLPFATRMDRFANTNRYTVNPEGRFQLSINLQDPRQQHRFRAMIVGVDERDRNNTSAARPMPNSLFVLLDGKEKRATFETVDIKHAYYEAITAFDASHEEFCREFLQTLDIHVPTEAVVELYDAYITLNNMDGQSAAPLLRALHVISRYKMYNTEIFQRVCRRLERSLAPLIQSDLDNALGIVDWLQKSSAITGDMGVKSRLMDMVKDTFEELVFVNSKMGAAAKLWQQMRGGEMGRELAAIMTDRYNMEKIDAIPDKLNLSECIAFLKLYVECAKALRLPSTEFATKIGSLCIQNCYRQKNEKSLEEIIRILQQDNPLTMPELLFPVAKDARDDGFTQYLLEYLIENDKTITDSDTGMISFCNKLKIEGLEQWSGYVAKKRFARLKVPEYKKYISLLDDLHRKGRVGEQDYTDILIQMDTQIQPENPDKFMEALTEVLLGQELPQAQLINASHVYAMKQFSQRYAPKDLGGLVKYLGSRGFPANNKRAYVDKFVRNIAGMQIPESEQKHVLDMLYKSPSVYLFAYTKELFADIKRQKEKWVALIKYVAKRDEEMLKDIIVKALVETRQNERTINELSQALTASTQTYFTKNIVPVAIKAIGKEKKGFLSGLFGKKNN